MIDARLYGLENAGLGRYVMNLLKYLSETDSKNEYILLLRKKYFDRLKLPPRFTGVLAEFRHYSLAEQVLLPALILKHKPDLVHFPHFNVPLFCPVPFVVTIHDILMHRQKGLDATTLSPVLYYFKRLGYSGVFRRAVTASGAVIVPSNFVKKEIVDYYKVDPDKVRVTYEGVDVLAGDKKPKVPGLYFIYSGNAYPHKNLKRLVEAIIELNLTTKERVYLLIASTRSVFTRRLEELIDKSNAGRFVKLLGFVPDEELGALYKHSLGFVFPSLSEGFGLPGLEAMNAGALSLVSDIPVFREVYKDAAIYFNPYDFSSIAKAMKEVVGMSKEERVKRIESGQNFIKRYSWRKMAEETLKIYASSYRLRSG